MLIVKDNASLKNLLQQDVSEPVFYGDKVNKGYVLLRREISLKVNCEKVKTLNCHFCNNVRDYEWTYI